MIFYNIELKIELHFPIKIREIVLKIQKCNLNSVTFIFYIFNNKISVEPGNAKWHLVFYKNKKSNSEKQSHRKYASGATTYPSKTKYTLKCVCCS